MNSTAKTADRGYYYKEIKMPTTKKEGLMNFIQTVINQLEAGESNNALLTAVDLLNDVRFGTYDEVDTGNLMANLQAEMQAQHQSELQACRDHSRAAGREEMRIEISKKLGLL